MTGEDIADEFLLETNCAATGHDTLFKWQRNENMLRLFFFSVRTLRNVQEWVSKAKWPGQLRDLTVKVCCFLKPGLQNLS